MRSNSVNEFVAKINLYGWLYEIASKILGTLQSIKDPPYFGIKLHLPFTVKKLNVSQATTPLLPSRLNTV
jgi:hypothetical protein